MSDLDRVLFDEKGWFALDAANQRVPGVVVPSLRAGLGLVGRGGVATVVGRLRDGIGVVDVDLEGERGHAAAEAIVAWCAERDVWTLVRPSGGADGRTHVFVAVHEHGEALSEWVDELRTSLGASRRDLDTRRQVRPLSAPHRAGDWTRPLGVLTEALAGLRQLTSRAASGDHSPTFSPVSLGEALVPRPRPRRDLPATWQAYLRTGKAPPVGGHDRSRSTVEAIATGHMVRAGYTATAAWAAIQAAHPRAMVRARASQRRWVRWVWDRAVREDTQTTPPRRVDPVVATAVQAGRERLWELQWALAPRRRAALLLVGHHVLDRIIRTGTLCVPVPERDLVLDTGITDRKIIRAALQILDGTLGRLVTDRFDPAKAAAGGSSFEFEIDSQHALLQSPPPSSHTPIAPPGLWAVLPRSCHALWRALAHGTDVLDLAEVGRRAGLSTTRSADLTPAQTRTVRSGLQALARVGLAECDAQGQWRACSEVDESTATRAAELHERTYAQVSAERLAYRTGEASSWNVARAAALKANRARERAWWDGLSPAERGERRQRWAHEFAALPVVEQELVKTRLADRRVRAGGSEADRHREWVEGLSDAEYLRRSIARQRWFEGLPHPLQSAYVATWARHRARYGIQRGTPAAQAIREHVTLLPDSASVRDAQFLQDQFDLEATPRHAAGHSA